MNQMPKIKPGMPGSARVEYLACREDVETMRAKGHNVSTIYEHLKAQGRVTCSYSAFCDYVRGGGKRKHSKAGKNPTIAKATVRPSPATEPRTYTQGTSKAFDINSVDVSTLI